MKKLLIKTLNLIKFNKKNKGEESMKKVSKIIATVINKNIQKEMDSACAIFGYQPVVPESAKKFKNRKKK